MSVNFDIKDSEKLVKRIPFKGILGVITLITSFFLVCPEWLLKKLFLLETRNTIGSFLGLTLIFCIAIWCVFLTSALIKKTRVLLSFSGNKAKKRFKLLSQEATAIVIQMYQSSSYSMELSIGEASTVILENSLFICRGQLSVYNTYFDYFLQPWVIKYLNKHFEEYKTFVKQERLH